MKAGALVICGVIALSASSAMAQAPAATAPATASIQSLLSSGYQVTAVTELSPDAQQQIWPNTPASPEVMITMQKGDQLAVCGLSPLSWINISQTAFNDPQFCKKQ
jgi:hypothetical protein